MRFNLIFPKTFMKKWYSLKLTDLDRNDLESQIRLYIQKAPDNNYGMKLPGTRLRRTGGAIKLRFSPESSNKGKSGSYRIIYFVAIRTNLYFLTVYGKNEKVALSDSENNAIRKLIKRINSKRGA